jgi:A/G-specific adenine glycosylase
VRTDLEPKTQNSKLAKLVPALLDWFAANARDLPWRSRKAGRDPYAVWVSEIMLQQTQVKTVIPYWERWLRELPTVEAVARASPDKVHKLWEGLGYYTRARNLQQAARQIVEKHGGKFPEHFDDVLALPGIGRYTAGAICSIAFNQPTPILDGNVIRVLTRVFGIAETPKEKETNARLWKLAEKLVVRAQTQRRERKTQNNLADLAPLREENSCSFLNQSLMELGALICTPRNPQCVVCPVNRLCVALQQNRVNELPNVGKRQITTARHFAAFVAERNGHFLVRQRPAELVNAHLWEFPNMEILNGKFNPNLAAKGALGVEPSSLQPLCTVKHSITRYRVTLEAFRVNLERSRKTRLSQVGVWKTPAQLQQLAFTAAHGKILRSTSHHGPVPKSAGR